MSAYGDDNGNRNGSRKSDTSRTGETDKRIDGLPLRTEPEIIFVDKEVIKVANLLRGGEGDCKRTTNDKVIANTLY